MLEPNGDNGGDNGGLGSNADNIDANLPRKRGRPRKNTIGVDSSATSINPADLDGNARGNTIGSDNSGDNRGSTRYRTESKRSTEKEAPLSVTDFIGILAIAQAALFSVVKAPEVILSQEQNELLATRYTAAANHFKTIFLTKKQKDIGLAIAATAMVAYTQAQAFYQRKANEAKPQAAPSFDMAT